MSTPQPRETAPANDNHNLMEEVCASGGHSLVFQPIFVPRDDGVVEILKYEALVRFPGRETEATIIELEKNPEAIMALTRNIIRETIIFLATTKKETGEKVPPIAVNLPPQLLESAKFLPDELKELLEKHELQGEDIQMEITERGVLDLERKKLRNFCDRLKALGVIVISDDFDDSSSQLSSEKSQTAFELVETSGIKGLKISAAFLLGKKAGNPGEVVDYAKKHDLCLVIEQVRDAETKEAVLEKLQALHFPKNKIGLQGYALSKPLTPEQLVGNLRKRHALKSLGFITGEAA